MEKQLLYAYMAGIVDGEGSISVKSESKSRPYIIYLNVTNCNYDMIYLFEKEFGGKVRSRKPKNKNWKLCYEWILSKKQAATTLKLLLPYIRIKRRQALLVLRLASIKTWYNGGYLRWNRDKWIKVERIYSKIKTKCKKLNRRGVLQCTLE